MPKTMFALVALACAAVMAMPVQAQQETTVGAVADKVQQYRTSLNPISGRVVLSYFYGDRAIEAEQGIAQLPGGERLPDGAHWSKYGCVYCEFTIVGDTWMIRAARLVNSGFREFGMVAGYGEGQEEPELRPERMPVQYEFCDGTRVVRYIPSKGTAEITPFDERSQFSGLRRELQEMLLTQNGILPAEKWLRGHSRVSQIDGGIQEVSRVLSSEGELSQCKVRVDPARNCAIVGYQAFGIQEGQPEMGARWVVDAYGERGASDAVWLPTRTVKHIFLYAPGRNPWHSTTVADWADVQVGKAVKWPGLLQLVVPLGTYMFDPRRLTGPRDGQAPGFPAGDLHRVLSEALRLKSAPPGFAEAFGNPIGAADLAALRREDIH